MEQTPIPHWHTNCTKQFTVQASSSSSYGQKQPRRCSDTTAFLVPKCMTQALPRDIKMHIRQIKTVQQTNQIIMRDEPRVSLGPACALASLHSHCSNQSTPATSSGALNQNIIIPRVKDLLDHLQNPEVMYCSYYKVKTLRHKPCVA